MGDYVKEGKAFHISQKEDLNAYKAVKSNKGAGGEDGIELEEFDKDWKNRLYVLWNRMSSGSYYPKPVRGVEIPKKNGKKRLLGIPAIEDRVAQMVLRNRLEPLLEPVFLDDSYGYRPGKSALDAIATTRNRCFKMKWVVEFDIVGLFDNINHEKLMELVGKYCKERWVLIYRKMLESAHTYARSGVERAERWNTTGWSDKPSTGKSIYALCI